MTETDRGVWGRLIATRRDQLDLTQEQLGEAAGVSEKTVYNVESGEVVPRSSTLRKLKEALGLPDDIRLANRFVRNAGAHSTSDLNENESAALRDLNAGTITRRQLMEFAQLLAEALDATEAGEEFAGSLSGWTREQIEELERITRKLLPNAEWRPRDVSGQQDRLPAVASTETRIEGAGQFDDVHAE